MHNRLQKKHNVPIMHNRLQKKHNVPVPIIIMLCSSSQFCSHSAHATIPIMPALCSNLKDSAHVFRNLHLLWV